MSSKTTLLAKADALRLLRLAHFPKCELNDIFSMEYYLFIEHVPFLGEKLYDALIADLVPTDTIASYVSATTYAAGDRVKYGGAFYESLVSANSTEPSNLSNWKLLDKFNTACFNELWCNYGLGEYLSRMLLLDSLADTVVSLSGSGLGIKVNKDSIPAKEDERLLFINGHRKKANRALFLMHKFISENYKEETDCFYDLLDSDDACDCTVDYKGNVIKNKKDGFTALNRVGSWSMY